MKKNFYLLFIITTMISCTAISAFLSGCGDSKKQMNTSTATPRTNVTNSGSQQAKPRSKPKRVASAANELAKIMATSSDQLKIVKKLKTLSASFDKIKQKADNKLPQNKSAQDCFIMGMFYEYGVHVERDMKIANIYYKKGANLEYAPAQYKVGCQNLQDGVLVLKARNFSRIPKVTHRNGTYRSNNSSLNSAVYNLSQSAKQGFPPAQLAWSIFRYRYSSYKDLLSTKEKNEWLQKAAQQGYKYAQYLLAKQKHADNIKKLHRLCDSLDNTLKTNRPTSSKVSEIKSTITKQKKEILTSFDKLKALMITQIEINKNNKAFMEGLIKTLQSKKQKLLQEFKPNAPEVIEIAKEVNQIKYDIAKLAKIREIHSFADMRYDYLYGASSNSVLFRRDSRRSYCTRFDIMTASPQEGLSKAPENLILVNSIPGRRDTVFTAQVGGFPLIAITKSHILDKRTASPSGQVQLMELATGKLLRTLDYYFISSQKGAGNLNIPMMFSPDGKYLLCRVKYSTYGFKGLMGGVSLTKMYSTALLYEVKTGKLICAFSVPSYTEKAIFWDGEYLIMGSALWYIKDLIPDFDSALVAKLAEARRLKLIAEKPLKDYNNYMKQGNKSHNYTAAIEMFKKALQIDLSKQKNGTALTAQAYYKLGYTYARNRSYKLAVEQYSKVFELYPETQVQALVVAEAHNGIAYIYNREKQYTTALGHYQKAYKVYKEKLGSNDSKSRRCLSLISKLQRRIKREAKKKNRKRRRR